MGLNHLTLFCNVTTKNTPPYLHLHKPCVKLLLSKRQKIGFQDRLSLNAGQKYCRMLQGEHSAMLSTFIKLPFVITIFILSIFEWPFYTGFTELLIILPLSYLQVFLPSPERILNNRYCDRNKIDICHQTLIGTLHI